MNDDELDRLGIQVGGKAKEGWYTDPAGRHQYRWFSQGAPTNLVRDHGRISRDELSLSDPELFETMELAHPPDIGPLLHRSARPARLELINAGVGPAIVVNTNAEQPGPLDAWAPAGVLEQFIVLGVPLIALMVLFAAGGPLIWVFPLTGFALVAAVVGRLRRRRAWLRLRRAVATPPADPSAV